MFNESTLFNLFPKFAKLVIIYMNVAFMHYKILVGEVTTDRGVEAERNTPSGEDCHCTHWPLVVSLIGCLAIVLGLVVYWFR